MRRDGTARMSRVVVDHRSLSLSTRTVLVDVYLFLRLSVFGFTGMLPLLGVLTVTGRLEAGLLTGLLVLALSFHAFVYVLNDVLDLEIDRSEPQRACSPLVRGRIRPMAASMFALVQVPLAFLVAASLGGGSAAIFALAFAFSALTVYNVWGKRCPVPPAIEMLQGLGWAALLLYGALVVGEPGARAAWLCGFVVAYVMLVNGVHGGLRDLLNDSACGARTTAIFLGAGPSPGLQSVRVPPALIGYAGGLHLFMFVCAFAVLGPIEEARQPLLWRVAFALVGIAVTACVALLVSAWRLRADREKATAVATWHLFVCMALPGLPLLAHAEPAASGKTAVVYALPIVAMWAYRKALAR